MKNRAGFFMKIDFTPEKNRNKEYCFYEYLNILNRGTELN